MEKKWWHDKVAYQIYPKSFLDTNGDGIGDLRGIISKLDYLKKLGIDIIWLSPIYKSPFVDQGYDIADYYAIAEEFGTMEEFDELLAEAKKRDMHIIMDLVINHCSDKHEWFQKALADPEGEYADYFYFREGKNGNPPSNYRSYFGGSCWEPVPGTDKYYFWNVFFFKSSRSSPTPSTLSTIFQQPAMPSAPSGSKSGNFRSFLILMIASIRKPESPFSSHQLIIS